MGDNVGDIAGMGADLFGSLAESTCAALVISSNTLFEVGAREVAIRNLTYPLVIVAFGIVVCVITSLVATYIS